MRLFVAVNFDKDTVEHLCKATEILRSHSVSANVSHPENLHLTLAFIGEVPSAKKAIEALSAVTCAPFTLRMQGYGEFSRSEGGSICFAKASRSEELQSLANEVRQNLTARGINIDPRPLKPHITLARQFVPSKTFSRRVMEDALTQRCVEVREISLMRSDRINGRLTYTEIFKKVL